MSVETRVILIVGIGGALLYYFIVRGATSGASQAVTTAVDDYGSSIENGVQTGLLTAFQVGSGLPLSQ
jgi:hypothetical protein